VNYSAFWGQSFVAELTRISAQGERKLKLRRASLIKQQPTIPESQELDVGKRPADNDKEVGEVKGSEQVETRSQTL
jgi:hypothetical protein